ncbi:hypothetical protein LTR78_010301 [Recurvomyces mirabilis]|uniref:Uncharacterized protein n=1 Tax=Recurvomyces mirabilis TaxID=574656 RepID=A0AAE0TQR3_9PEZI|nr:hypothetical protein LTR78_010301 [Recurvomyces mirabilis]KAK5149629.1 hypothetical protein LTS14_010760 [Recurvomyces mirabilis]
MYVKQLTNKPPAFYAVALVVTLAPLYFGSYQYRIRHPYGGGMGGSFLTFIQDWLDRDLIQPFDPSPIAAHCKRSTWRSDLIFNLEGGPRGDVAELRSSVLDFIFYAIEASASIVLPYAEERAGFNEEGKAVELPDFGMLFDRTWFLEAIGQACPQMTVYTPGAEMEDMVSLPRTYTPYSRRIDIGKGNTKDDFLHDLDAWLKEGVNTTSGGRATLVSLERSLCNEDVRRLAATVVKASAAMYPWLKINAREVIPSQAFVGAYLHTFDYDAESSKNGEAYSGFSAQADALLAYAAQHNSHVVYTASENVTELARLKQKAAYLSPPIIAITKFSVLTDSDVNTLKSLTPRQQKLVDYEVLRRSSVFVGPIWSPMSYAIALARNEWWSGQGRVNDPWYVTHAETGIAFDDGMSRVLGRDGLIEQRVVRAIWP